MNRLADVETLLAAHRPQLLDCGECTRAAVALILAEGDDGPQLLLIERATDVRDPWSGNVGLPGGKVEEGDRDERETAERETMEEVGLDLGRGRCLGRLSDVIGSHLPVRVSCFVFRIDTVPPLRLSGEVSDAFWVPLAELLDPARRVEGAVRFNGETFARPAIRLSRPGKPLLWGLTYGLVIQFLELVEKDGLTARELK